MLIRNGLIILLMSCSAWQAYAQKEIQVREEPRHKNVFENAYLRILDVYIRPSDTTLFHKHSTASVIIVFTNTRLSTEEHGEAPVFGHTVPGSITYAAFDENPVFHRVINNDTSLFHVMDIELLGNAATSAAEVSRELDILPAWQQNRVNAYTIYAEAGQVVHKTPSKRPQLLVCVTGSASLLIGNATNPVTMIIGSFAWIERSAGFQVTGQSTPGTGFVLLDLNQ
ncbi:MAG: hypothetical protein ACHQEM_10015 [Chitinophagales bacterium]